MRRYLAGMILHLLVLVGLLFVYGPIALPAAKPPADRIFINGQIWTGETATPQAQALAIRGGFIVAIGTNHAALKVKGPQTEVVDLHGTFVYPGFIDAHMHLLSLEQIELAGAKNLADIQQCVASYAKDHLYSEWLQGGGWAYSMFPNLTPHRSQIDAFLADRPVVLTDRDLHTLLANSKALTLAGITKDTKDPEGGVIVRDPQTGEPTGHLKEAAMDLVNNKIPKPTQDVLYQTLLKRLEQAAACGLTSVQIAEEIDLPIWERVAAEGKLKVRVYAALPLTRIITPEQLARYKSLRRKHQGPLIKLGALKGFLDGTIDSKTAAMYEPYVGDGGTGLLLWRQQDIDAAVAEWDKEGFQIMIHAIGDKAVHMALDAYEKAAAQNRTSGRRHRIEHIEVPLLTDLPRFKALQVIASTQAIYANPDQTVLENFQVVLGPARASHADAFRLFDDAGIRQAFGSDFPVLSMAVLRGIYAAVTRTTPEGTPPGGWYPEHRISATAALQHFTIDAAFASFEENLKGTLRVGKYADMTVLSENILMAPPTKLLSAKVLRTVMGGRDTYRQTDF